MDKSELIYSTFITPFLEDILDTPKKFISILWNIFKSKLHNKLNNNLYNFSWYTYKFARGARNQLTKYLNGNTDFAAKKDLHHYTLKPGESIRYNDNLS